eukprot:CAMPEP_0172186190 /NCGR_PEP_ID=MMETSP1050-20130122/20614_1 /TAXON_ID=233186 /ORGANISM="Cryptomonas curvata, Strain CCAP979/52" /LENGTH=144 /DNA_ID=CAMNT_0012860313 /DNA_START=678 /DNA_END=1114 /DNA_ORIENTATION=-
MASCHDVSRDQAAWRQALLSKAVVQHFSVSSFLRPVAATVSGAATSADTCSASAALAVAAPHAYAMALRKAARRSESNSSRKSGSTTDKARNTADLQLWMNLSQQVQTSPMDTTAVDQCRQDKRRRRDIGCTAEVHMKTSHQGR